MGKFLFILVANIVLYTLLGMTVEGDLNWTTLGVVILTQLVGVVYGVLVGMED